MNVIRRAWVGTAFAVAAAGNVQAFGVLSTGSFEYRSANERAVLNQQLDIMERKKAGQYGNPVYNITNNNTTNIAGDQINCDVSATSLVNSSTNSATGESGAPSILNSPTISAGSTGSVAGGETGGPLNAGGGGTVSTDQTVQSSTITSDVAGSTIGGVSGAGGVTTSALDQNFATDQVLNNSNVGATIGTSRACAFGQ